MKIRLNLPKTPDSDGIRELLEHITAEMGISASIGFGHTPSGMRVDSSAILVDGRPIPDPPYPPGPADSTTDTIPPVWLIQAALLRELAPRGWLFMCVHNSARSQLAEAIARHLAPEGVTVMSAGSEPSRVHPMVPRVLEEAGISADGLHSKGTDGIEPRDVQATVTLCAEEVCPVFLARAWHVHWPMPDPAAQTDPDAQLRAFRRTRDELISRLTVLMDYTL